MNPGVKITRSQIVSIQIIKPFTLFQSKFNRKETHTHTQKEEERKKRNKYYISIINVNAVCP